MSITEPARRLLEQDLAGFADPNTAVTVLVDGRVALAEWTQRGQAREEQFRLETDGGLRWIPGDGDHPLHYSDFLRDDQMADFSQLAAATVRAAAFGAEPHYVPTNASRPEDEGGLQQSDGLLIESIDNALEEGSDRTSLFFIKGDAGAGKTTLLRHLTRLQADRYLGGLSPFLFFYVSAQGRALTNLRDAFSGELDDLRAGFTRDAVPTLARHGLLIPIVDGFDELLGAAGYGDAFGSLQQFLEELEGLGVLIASARSSFYDLEFLSKAPRSSSGFYTLAPVDLHPWNEEQLDTFLRKVRDDPDRSAMEEALSRLSPQDRAAR